MASQTTTKTKFKPRIQTYDEEAFTSIHYRLDSDFSASNCEFKFNFETLQRLDKLVAKYTRLLTTGRTIFFIYTDSFLLFRVPYGYKHEIEGEIERIMNNER